MTQPRDLPDTLACRLPAPFALHLCAFATRLPAPLGELAPSPGIAAALDPAARAPFAPDPTLKVAVRKALRAGGFRPSGRNKPACEYLLRAAGEGALRSINPLVDACNATSLHSQIPISVIDLDRATAPLSIQLPPPDTRYVFNPSGQEIDVSGLPCIFDASGPCANAVKDAQRTKTHDRTRATLSVLWGPASHRERVDRACAWYRELLATLGATTDDVSITATD